ncbi:MAG: hypothetical protein ABUT20_51025, partial [Bacteroidota bacterium]
MKAARYLVIVLVLLIPGIAAAQTTPTASQLLHNIYAKLQKARDYSVQANIKVDMPFIRMLPIDAKI